MVADIDIPTSEAVAQAELAQITNFLGSVETQIRQANARAGFLTGWLAAKGALNMETDDSPVLPIPKPSPVPKVAPTKRTNAPRKK